jgi:uncharacterized protein (DUF885 family)
MKYVQFFKRALCERKIPTKLGKHTTDQRVRDFLKSFRQRSAFLDHQRVVFTNTFMYGEGKLSTENVQAIREIGEKHNIYPVRSVMRLHSNWKSFKHKLKFRSDDKIGLACIPQGDKMYNMIIRQTSGMSTKRVRALGKREHASTTRKLLHITNSTSIEEAARKCSNGSIQSFESYAHVKSFVKNTILRSIVRVCKDSFPRAKLKISDFPPIEVRKLRPGMSMAYYELPRSTCKYPLGHPKQKGKVVIQIEDLHKVNVAELTVLIAHEVFPGHFYQTAVFRTPPYIYANWFVEGWALYTERVCDVFGPAYVAARLLMRLLRAARCIIDPAIHLDKLSLAKAKKRFAKLVPHLSEQIRTSELLRYVAIPGQACGYLPGACLIEKWARKFGSDKQRLMRFHEKILLNGAGSVEYVRANLFRNVKRR